MLPDALTEHLVEPSIKVLKNKMSKSWQAIIFTHDNLILER
jgi:hypothetical protein